MTDNYEDAYTLEELDKMDLEDMEFLIREMLRTAEEFKDDPDMQSLLKRLEEEPIGSELGMKLARGYRRALIEAEIRDIKGLAEDEPVDIWAYLNECE